MKRDSRIITAMPISIQERIVRLYHFYYFFRKRITAGYYKRKSMGTGSRVDPDALVLGWKNIKVGKNVMIAEGVVINVNNRDEKIRIVIGDNTAINRDCFFVNAGLIELGAYTLFGPGCRLLGGNHIFSTPFTPYIASGNTDHGAISIGANCWFGAGVSVIGNVNIGHGCVIGANAMVLKNVPPFSLVIGSPARVVKRFDVAGKEWVLAEHYTSEQEAAIPKESDYLEQLRIDYPTIMMPFAASGRASGDLA